ncbi:hypothetical protein C4565_10425 [Candidatus Parcubacteria bacterium]|nr:MAG: hypothetical protein C4565_10425 [Candidatus Parcubacteria bacterium]
MDTLNLLGGIASITALLIMLGTYFYKSVMKYRNDKREAEQKFKTQLQLYKDAGGTHGARTDLSFFLLNRIGLLRELIIKFQNFKILFLILFSSIGIVIILKKMSTGIQMQKTFDYYPEFIRTFLFAWSSYHIKEVVSQWANLFVLLFELIVLPIVLYFSHYLEKRYTKLELHYAKCLEDMLEKPIQKHINRSCYNKDDFEEIKD